MYGTYTALSVDYCYINLEVKPLQRPPDQLLKYLTPEHKVGATTLRFPVFYVF
jgi:hypothetical protein